jgi:hypothetical protein
MIVTNSGGRSEPSVSRAVAVGHQRRLFHKADSMDYRAFTNDSLTMMYEAARGALAADDALKRQGIASQFRVRETPEWKKARRRSRT